MFVRTLIFLNGCKMKKSITLICLLFSITLLNAQDLTKGLKEVPFLDLECPENAVFCFTEISDLEIGPADDFFGKDIELVTKFSNTVSLSKIRFWGLIARESIVYKNGSPPAVDFRVKIYEVGANGPGKLIESFTFENIGPAEIIDSGLKNEDHEVFFCMYDLNLPKSVALDGEGFIGITRINNFSERKLVSPEGPFIFFPLGDYNQKYEQSGVSFMKGFTHTVGKSDADTFNHLLSAEKTHPDGWEAVPFKPFFALSGSAPVPVSNFAVYLGMVLIAGFSIFFFRRWIG